MRNQIPINPRFPVDTIYYARLEEYLDFYPSKGMPDL